MYKPIFRITSYLLGLVEEAGRLRFWIENATIRVSWLPILQREARAKRTHSSTSIEGNPLSINQVEAVARGEKIGVPQVYEKEVANYLKAMRWIEKHAHAKITEKAILELHKILLQNILPAEKCGKYKEKQNYVVNEKGIRIYTPPSPKEAPKLMKDLTGWINSNETEELHSILVGAVIHHRLASIHPFTDGNGRIARALGTWILYQRDFDTRHIFSLDDFFAGDRRRYYQKIEQARELDNDLTFWVEYVAEGIVNTLKDVRKRIEDLQVSSKFQVSLSSRQEEVLRILRDRPPQSGAELKKALNITRARINQILSPLIANGLVAKEGKSRATRYRLA